MKLELRRMTHMALVAAVGVAAAGSAWALGGPKNGDARSGAAKSNGAHANGAKNGSKPGVDPDALGMLRTMSNFLASQGQFSVRAQGETEVVTKNGEKVEFDHSSQVWMKRPNKLRSDRRGDKVAAEFYYDGRNFTLLGRADQYYAQAPAPPTLDQAIDCAREKLGLETPVGDFLYSSPYDVMTEDLVTIADLGTGMVDGVPCHHLAIRGTETDRQIWIEQGARPVPRRLVITSKKVKEAPEFRVELSEWNFKPDIDDKLFRYTPSSEARKIEFMPVKVAHKNGGS